MGTVIIKVMIDQNSARGAENILDTFLVQNPQFYFITYERILFSRPWGG